MTRIQIRLVTFTDKTFIPSTLSRWVKFCPLRWKKRYFLTLPHTGAAHLASKFLSMSWTLCDTSLPLHEPYKSEFLIIVWRISCPYTWKTWRYYCPLWWNFWGIGGLYMKDEIVGYMLDTKNFPPAFLWFIYIRVGDTVANIFRICCARQMLRTENVRDFF